MSKKGYISRYLLILKKLKIKPYSTYEDLKLYIESSISFMQMKDDSLYIGFSKRTLQRDLKEIRNVFGIDIEYSKIKKGYFITHNESENMNFQRMIESFDLFNSLNLAHDLSPIVFLENRKPQGTENFVSIINSIKNRTKITFSYVKFIDKSQSNRLVEPYALKEFKNRWYLLAKDCKDNMIKSFALDRLNELAVTKFTFEYPENYSIEDRYRYCFGIIYPLDSEPVEIILSLDSFISEYIKTLPIHESQKIIVDNKMETRVKLNLFITNDLIMELLSYGKHVKVIKPKELVDKIKKELKNAYNIYENANNNC